MPACTGLKLLVIARPEGPVCSYRETLAGVMRAGHVQYQESLPRGNKGILGENTAYLITILLVPIACNIMNEFMNCQRPPIKCKPR